MISPSSGFKGGAVLWWSTMDMTAVLRGADWEGDCGLVVVWETIGYENEQDGLSL